MIATSHYQRPLVATLWGILSIICCAVSIAQVQAAISADEIIAKVRDRDDGHSFISNVTLKLIDTKGRTRDRHMHMVQKDDASGREDVFMSFHSPSDVRGVSFMMRLHPEVTGKPDDQWLYLPAFRKTRRIGSNDQRGMFMGSTFNYSDLTKIKVSDYDSKIIGEERIKDRDTWVVERTPSSQEVINKTGYYKQKLWIDKERFIVLKYDYFDAKGIIFKTQETLKVEEIQNIWTITQSSMFNTVTGKKSEMIFEDLKYDIDLDGSTFSTRTMKKGLKKQVTVLLEK